MFHRQAGFILAIGMPIALTMLGSAWLDRLTQIHTHTHAFSHAWPIYNYYLACMDVYKLWEEDSVHRHNVHTGGRENIFKFK